LDQRLSAYLAASSIVGTAASEAQAVVVSDSTVQPFGINQHVNIDFNSDGQVDYQIDHDRVNLNGTDLDYLQIDKNDVSSAANPYPIDNFAVFPTNGTNPNADHEYVTDAEPGDNGYYPKALLSGAEIGPLTTGWDFQEGENFRDQDLLIRGNRLIDEDATQIDEANPNPPPSVVDTFVPFGTPGWIGIGGQTRYLGLRMDLNDAGQPSFNTNAANYWYGWIGVRITSEMDATGEVVGWGYETEKGMSINAGETGIPAGPQGDFNFDGTIDAADYVIWRKNNGSETDYGHWKTNFGDTIAGTGGSVGFSGGQNAVPEPSSLLMGMLGSLALLSAFVLRRVRRIR
jgi:hypothetical protein